MSGSRLSRRAVLEVAGLSGIAGTLTAGALTGCDLDPSSAPRPSVVPPPDPDGDIVRAARSELRGLLARLSSTSGTASLVACHRQQLVILQGDPPTGHDRPLTKLETEARERRAAERFTHWALACHNGDLARILASVAAGIRMQPVLREAP